MFGRSSGKDKVLGSFILSDLVILFSMLCGAVAVRAMTARAREFYITYSYKNFSTQSVLEFYSSCMLCRTNQHLLWLNTAMSLYSLNSTIGRCSGLHQWQSIQLYSGHQDG